MNSYTPAQRAQFLKKFAKLRLQSIPPDAIAKELGVSLGSIRSWQTRAKGPKGQRGPITINIDDGPNSTELLTIVRAQVQALNKTLQLFGGNS